MGKLLKKLFYALLICGFLYSCVYHKMTHMSSDELAWVANRKAGEIMYFKSQSGKVDTIKTLEVFIHNSLDPINWGYFNTSSKSYIATANVRYGINKNDGGILSIEKKLNHKSICFSSILSEGWQYDVPLKITSLRIRNVTLDDVMIFDNSNLEPPHNKSQKKVMSYAWSKKYGLVQYTFKDGTVFTRIDIR